MSEPHAPAAHGHSTTSQAGESLWRQGAGVGTGVGFALSVALAIGVGTTRFPMGGMDMLLAQLAGVAIGVVIGAFAGLVIGSFITADVPAKH